MSDDEGELEIIDACLTAATSTEPDDDDIRFQLRMHEAKIKEHFPHIKTLYDLDTKELRTAKEIIEREKNSNEQRQLNIVDNIAGQKRKIIEDHKPPITNKPSLLNPSNALLKQHIASKQISNNSTRWNGKENMKLVGSHLINMDNLLRNAPRANSAPSSSGLASSSNAKNVPNETTKQKEDQLFAEIDKLLSQKSSHDHEANDDWHKNFQKRLKTLEKQEWKDNKRQQVQFVIVPAFECISCDHFITELYPSLCSDKKHIVQPIKAVKRFFICRNCNRRDFTLTNQGKMNSNSISGPKLFPPPRRNCSCGKDDWTTPGSNSSMLGAVSSLVGEKLVTSATDWTSKGDRLNMASRVSTLDK